MDLELSRGRPIRWEMLCQKRSETSPSFIYVQRSPEKHGTTGPMGTGGRTAPLRMPGGSRGGSAGIRRPPCP
jgi:hypothetical protein